MFSSSEMASLRRKESPSGSSFVFGWVDFFLKSRRSLVNARGWHGSCNKQPVKASLLARATALFHFWPEPGRQFQQPISEEPLQPFYRSFSILMLSLVAIGGAIRTQAQYAPISFNYNVEFATSGINNGNTFPTGNQTLGGVPFSIPSGQNNYWSAYVQGGSNPITLSIPVGFANVDQIHTLINTYWGQSGPNSYASLTFLYSDGSSFSKALVGNVDIRDYNNYIWTNSINGTTTINVFDNGEGQRLDKQEITVPLNMVSKTLQTLEVADTGGSNFQRVFLAGLTVHQTGLIKSVSPSHVNAGGPAFTLVVKGSGFLNGSAVAGNGSLLTTTFVSAAELKASVPASLIANVGRVSITVVNMDGSSSTSEPLTILLTTIKLVSATMGKDNAGNYTAAISLQNIGYNAANNVTITKSSLGAAAT